MQDRMRRRGGGRHVPTRRAQIDRAGAIRRRRQDVEADEDDRRQVGERPVADDRRALRAMLGTQRAGPAILFGRRGVALVRIRDDGRADVARGGRILAAAIRGLHRRRNGRRRGRGHPRARMRHRGGLRQRQDARE